MPYDEIGDVLDRSGDASRQLASRGRRRIREVELGPEDPSAPDKADQRVVGAFLTAARDGDVDALVAILDPGVVRRVTTADGRLQVARGAVEVATRASAFVVPGLAVQETRIAGRPSLVTFHDGRILTVVGFTIQAGRITAMDIRIDPHDPASEVGRPGTD